MNQLTTFLIRFQIEKGLISLAPWSSNFAEKYQYIFDAISASVHGFKFRWVMPNHWNCRKWAFLLWRDVWQVWAVLIFCRYSSCLFYQQCVYCPSQSSVYCSNDMHLIPQQALWFLPCFFVVRILLIFLILDSKSMIFLIYGVYIIYNFTAQTTIECWPVMDTFLADSLGAPFYIIREILDVVFYALGDGQQPFLITVSAIALNGILDWLFTSRFHLGAEGLVVCNSFLHPILKRKKLINFFNSLTKCTIRQFRPPLLRLCRSWYCSISL